MEYKSILDSNIYELVNYRPAWFSNFPDMLFVRAPNTRVALEKFQKQLDKSNTFFSSNNERLNLSEYAKKNSKKSVEKFYLDGNDCALCMRRIEIID